MWVKRFAKMVRMCSEGAFCDWYPEEERECSVKSRQGIKVLKKVFMPLAD